MNEPAVKSPYGLAFDKYVDDQGITPEDAIDIRYHFHAGWMACEQNAQETTLDVELVFCESTVCTWCKQPLWDSDSGEYDEARVRALAEAHITSCPEHPVNKPLPCGHPARYVYPPTGGEGTTHYCLACVSVDQKKAQ